MSIGSKSLNWRKKVGVKFSDIFLWIEWLERNFSYFAITLPLDFPEIFNIFEITAYFIFQLIWGCDVIKFLNRKPEEWKTFAWYHTLDVHKLCFSGKLFDVSSKSLEITVVLSFFQHFSWILKKEEKHSNSENIEDFWKVQR